MVMGAGTGCVLHGGAILLANRFGSSLSASKALESLAIFFVFPC